LSTASVSSVIATASPMASPLGRGKPSSLLSVHSSVFSTISPFSSYCSISLYSIRCCARELGSRKRSTRKVLKNKILPQRSTFWKERWFFISFLDKKIKKYFSKYIPNFF
jgi:hypothetical protein